MYKKSILYSFIFISGIVISPSSYANAKAGIVILSKGNFYAVDSKNIKRALKRRSPVFEGDILSTGDDAISQVRFIDNAVISLRSNTSLRIDEYKQAGGNIGSKENGVISLLKGGFRTITGAINKNNYKVQTEVASIGIRGTEYEVVLDNGLNVAAWHGSITVKNKIGVIALGLEKKHNFAHIAGSNTLPVGLLYPPSSLMPLRSPIFNAQKKKIKQFKKKPVRPVAFNNKKSVFNPIQSKVRKAYLNPTQIINNTGTIVIPSAVNQRDISAVNLDRIGIAVFNGPDKFFGGRASSGVNGSPVITDNGFGPHELPDFFTAPPNIAIWRNGAAALSETIFNIGTKEISYGKWDKASQTQPIMQIDPLGIANEAAISNYVYWITAQPSAPLAVSNRTGSASYGFGSNFIGSSNSGNFDFNSGSISVNFDTNSISGTIQFGITSFSNWTVNFNGTVRANVLDAQLTSSTVTYGAGPKSIQGELPMIFTGNGATAVAGAFKLEEVNNSSVHAEGVFVMEEGL